MHIATALPSFAIPPNPFFGPDGSVDIDSHNFSRLSDSPPPRRSVGLLEPKNTFLHHGLVLAFYMITLVGGCIFTDVGILLRSLDFVYTAGIAPRFQNYASLANLIRMDNGQCGATANSVALLK